MKSATLIANVSPAVLLLGIAILIVLIIVLLLILLWRTKRKQETEPDEAGAQETATEETGDERKAVAPIHPEEIQPSVSSAVRFLNQNSSGRGTGYGTPWFLTLGAAGSGKSTLLDHSGISLSLREGAADFGVAQGIKWRFFYAGVILFIPRGVFLQADKNASDERSWKELLRTLRSHR